MWNLKAKIVNVEAAILHGDLSEGMDASKEEYLSLIFMV
jgi:hypothetical protein